MDRQTFDAIIIGFGKAGKTLAATLGKAGQKVALVEKSSSMYGGTCINIACIPTKVLVSDAEKKLDFSDAMSHKDAVVTTLRAKNHAMLQNNDHVTLFDGTASFVDKNTVAISAGDEKVEITAPKIFINTGSLPVMPGIPGIESTKNVFSSTTLLDIATQPKRLAIIGGGYIGLEFASTYAALGSEVTVFEKGESLLAHEDEVIVDSVKIELEKQGITFHFSANIAELKNQDDQVVVTNNDETHVFDAVLIAAGRRPNTDDLKLENAQIDMAENGSIVVNDALQTYQPNIWALGDVNGGPQFTYISLDDFRIVKSQLLGDGSYTRKQRKPIAFSVFMQLPLSRIGLTEKAARSKNMDIAVYELQVAAIPRAHVDSSPTGILRAIVDANTSQIIGASLHCKNSPEIINIVKLAMDARLPYTVLRDQIFTHPTMAESLNELFSNRV